MYWCFEKGRQDGKERPSVKCKQTKQDDDVACMQDRKKTCSCYHEKDLNFMGKHKRMALTFVAGYQGEQSMLVASG